MIHTWCPNSKVDASAAYMSTTARIGTLAAAASLPCNTLVTLTGQTSGTKAYSCLPVAANKQAAVREGRGHRG